MLNLDGTAQKIEEDLTLVPESSLLPEDAFEDCDWDEESVDQEPGDKGATRSRW